MLTPDEIKKLIEIAKPYGFIGHEKSCSSYTIEYLKSAFEIEYDTLKGSANREVYELFLQRCRQGVNRSLKTKPFKIYSLTETLFIMNIDIHLCIQEYKDTDEGLEEALRYILEKTDGI